jgi:hypothetical protein
MASIATASTIVAAVLETAGYKTQEFILTFLGVHLAGLATFLWVVSALIGLMMIALFARYRFGLYLILGPTLFYFLVGTQGQLGGTVWRLGNGSVRTPQGPATSEEEGLLAVKELSPGISARDQINVALPFKLYTQAVDRIVKTIVNAILPLSNQIEEDKNLLFVNRTYALETLLASRIDHPEAMQMFNGEYLVSCKTMMDAAIGLGNPELSLTRRRQLESERDAMTNARTRSIYDEAIRTLDANRAKFTEQWERGKTQRVALTPTVRRFLNDNQTRTDDLPGVRRYYAGPSRGQESMTCEEMWDIVADAITLNAIQGVEALRSTYASQLAPETRGLLCLDLARKMGVTLGDAGEFVCGDGRLATRPIDQCRDSSGQALSFTSVPDYCEKNYLVTIAGTLMLRSAITSLSASQSITRIKNDMEFIATEKRGTVYDLGEKSEEWELVNSQMLSPDQVGSGAYLSSSSNVFSFLRSKNGSEVQRMGLYRNKNTGAEEWRPIAVLRADVLGNYDTVMVDHQRYQTTELRQRFFTLSLNFPYYQGLLLYLLSVAYPFFAIIVVVPGRAGAFLNYLLAWLWVKSWDVGFAMLIILDKILWNLFPGQDFTDEFVARRKISEQALPELLTEAFKADPAYNVHAYYFVLSVAGAAIPTICAYGTLKLRRGMTMAVSSPLTNKLMSRAQEYGITASGSYGKVVMNIRNAQTKELSGAALLSVGVDHRDWQGGSSYSAQQGGLRATSAETWAKDYAAAATNAQVARMRFSDANLMNIAATAPAIQEAVYRSTYSKVLESETRLEARERQVYHPVFGRFGRLQLMTAGSSAALDGSGGYEIVEFGSIDNLYSARIGIVQMKLNMAAEIRGNNMFAQKLSSGTVDELTFLEFLRREGLRGQMTAPLAVWERGEQEFVAATKQVMSDFNDLAAGQVTGLERRIEAIDGADPLITSLRQAYFDWIEQKKASLSEEQIEKILSAPVWQTDVAAPIMPFFSLPDLSEGGIKRQNPDDLRLKIGS